MTTDVNTIEIDIYGQKLAVPKEQAEKIIAGRDADKVARRELGEKIGAAEREKAIAETAAADEKRAREVAEAAKTGDIKKLEELHTEKLRTERAKLGSQLRDEKLAAALAARGVPAKYLDAATRLARESVDYNYESHSLVVLGKAGQPLKDDSGKDVQVDSWATGWLEQNDCFVLSKTPQGSGAISGGKGTGGKTVSQATFDGMEPRARAVFLAAEGAIQG